MPWSSSGGRSSAGVNPKTAPRNESRASSVRRCAVSPRKPCPSPSKARYAYGMPWPSRAAARASACAGRHDPVLEPLQDQDRHRDLIEEVDRRAIAVSLGHRRIWADEALVVARFELVAIARDHLQVGDPERADARSEYVAEGERRERRIAAGTATFDGEPVTVHVAAIDQIACGRRRSRRHRRCPTGPAATVGNPARSPCCRRSRRRRRRCPATSGTGRSARAR